MKILVSGGGGFIGSHLVEVLLQHSNNEVIVLDDFSTGRETNLSHIDTNRLKLIKADVRNIEDVNQAISGADAVYHLAAAVGVKRVVQEPIESLKTNLRGTENILEAAARTKTPTFIASSSEVYGKGQSVPFSEEDDRVLGPTNITRWGYATSKATDEFLSLSYQEELDLPVVVGRYFNIAGPRQTGEYGMVIPRFVQQALAGKPLTVYGDGTQTRSFTHVRDAVELTHKLLETPKANGEVVNIATPEPTSVNELAKRVIELTNSDSEIRHTPFDNVFGEEFEEPSHREPDVTKLRELVHQVPKADLDRILLDVIAEHQRDKR